MSDGILHRTSWKGFARNFKSHRSKLIKNIRLVRWLDHVIVKLAASKVNYTFFLKNSLSIKHALNDDHPSNKQFWSPSITVNVVATSHDEWVMAWIPCTHLCDIHTGVLNPQTYPTAPRVKEERRSGLNWISVRALVHSQLAAGAWEVALIVLASSLAFRQSAGLQSYCRPTYHSGVVKKQSHMYASACMKYCILSLCEDLDSYHSSSCSTAGKCWGHFSNGRPHICIFLRARCTEWLGKHLTYDWTREALI